MNKLTEEAQKNLRNLLTKNESCRYSKVRARVATDLRQNRLI